MVFAGKPSKGCLSCRQKRTKCDLVLPACTQCVRTNRICTGYRNEQDLVFRNQTGQIVRKTKQKRASQPAQLSFEENFMLQQLSSTTLQPSRRALLNDEAVLHFFGHYKENFFASSGRLASGVDYITPVYMSDLARGGPVPEIVIACGLAALGNMKGSPELVTEARTRQVKVLRQLNKQLEDPTLALTDSSILTCSFLSTFEFIVSDGLSSIIAQTAHLKGAAKLAELRGKSQFKDDIGHGIYARMRGVMLAHCLRARETVPDFIVKSLEDEVGQRDFEPDFYNDGVRACQLLADHKVKGFVDANDLKEATTLTKILEVHDPAQRPATESAACTANADEAYRGIFNAAGWLIKVSTRLLVSDVVVAWAQAQYQTTPSTETLKAWDDATNYQLRLFEGVKGNINYYVDSFATFQVMNRTVGAHALMYPLSILSQLSTTSPDNFIWIAKQAQKVSELFGIKLGKIMADFIWMRIRAAAPPQKMAMQTPPPSSHTKSPSHIDGLQSSYNSQLTEALSSPPKVEGVRWYPSPSDTKGMATFESPTTSNR